MGAPSPVSLVEMGPGGGTDGGRVTRDRPWLLRIFTCEAAIHLVETSPRLRAAQRQRLGAVCWHEAIDTLPRGPMIVLGNEFLDALPGSSARPPRSGWTERFVSPGEKDHRKIPSDNRADD